MDWTQITLVQFQRFFLIFTRMTAFTVSAPIIGSRNVPVQVKIGFGALLAFIVMPMLIPAFPELPGELIPFALLMGQEMIIGLILGFVCIFIFTGAQIAGQIFGMQMGLGIVNVIDPQSELQVSLMGQVMFLVAILIFLGINGHHIFIKAIVDSYRAAPIGGVKITESMAWQMVKMFDEVFIIGVKIGAPVIAVLMVINAAMGFVARAVPQMNIFIVGIPINILIGFLILAASMFFAVAVLRGYFDQFFGDLYLLMKTMG